MALEGEGYDGIRINNLILIKKKIPDSKIEDLNSKMI